jgi:hypothetical protein
MDENLAWITKSATVFDMTDEVQIHLDHAKNLTQDLNILLSYCMMCAWQGEAEFQSDQQFSLEFITCN